MIARSFWLAGIRRQCLITPVRIEKRALRADLLAPVTVSCVRPPIYDHLRRAHRAQHLTEKVDLQCMLLVRLLTQGAGYTRP